VAGSVNIEADLAEVRAALAYHDGLVGTDADCGLSCKMVSINLLRLLVRAFDEQQKSQYA